MLAINGFTIKELIYQNSNVSVYSAVRNTDNKKITLKICQIDSKFLNELTTLQHEYQILKQLNLPKVVHVYDLVRYDDKLVLVLENVKGLTLRQFLHHQALSLPNFFKIAIELAEIIGDLHLQHVIHKDINPNTIYVDRRTLEVTLGEFSIASQLVQENFEAIQIKNIEGTLAYISPEQTGRLNHPIDHRTDFYSLGVTFYEMLTGQVPFFSDDPLKIIHQHLAKMPQSIDLINPSIPRQLALIIAKLLNKSPDDRYASAIGLKSDLQECQSQWHSKGRIDEFPLGQKDIHADLTLSHKIYGRDPQLQELQSTFERVSQGNTEFLLISGYSGIGKTSLVKELYKPITRQRGYFVMGKYDQLQKTTPYSAIIEAFQSLVKRILAEPEEYLQKLKQTLLQALGNNGQVIIDVIPNVALIIGPQPPVAVLPPAEAQNRFVFTLQGFVRALSQADHPLVVFLDDLQWIDGASLQFIYSLLSDTELHYLLLIGAYRDNEVSADHPFAKMLQQIQKLKVNVNQISLVPLLKIDIQQMLSDSLDESLSKVDSLADLLIIKTNGNPFFINQFLKLLYQKELLKYSHENQGWEWDILAIRNEGITDNVIDLLIYRIKQLPIEAQNLLQLAACIGHTFDLQTLSIISEISVLQTIRILNGAISINLIVPKEGEYRISAYVEAATLAEAINQADLSYKFMHDRIQQAAYQLIPNEVRQQVHFRVGKLLLNKLGLSENSEYLFDIVNHFTQSLSLIIETVSMPEKKQFAQYCIWAGKKAKASTAYQAAKNYLQAAEKLLSPIDWFDNSSLVFELYKELAVSQYLTGDFTEAQATLDMLQEKAQNNVEKINIYKLNCEMLATLNKHNEALILGLKALKIADINLPSNPNLLHILYAILKIKKQLGWQSADHVDLKPVSDPEYQAIIDLLSQLFNSAFIINQHLFLLLVATSMYLSLKYGYADSTGFACVVYAFSVIHALNWYQEGISFVELYNKLAKQYSSPNFLGRTNFVLSAFIYPWVYPINKAVDAIMLAYQNSYETGDLAYSNYSNNLLVIMSDFAGLPLQTTLKHNRAAIAFLERIKTNDFYEFMSFYEYGIQSLMSDSFSKRELNAHIKSSEQKIINNKNITELAFFYSIAAKLSYLFEDYEKVEYYSSEYAKLAEYNMGMVSWMEAPFYRALAITNSVTNKKELSLKQKRIVKSTLKKLKRWSSWCSANFEAYLNLLQAENYRLDSNWVEAIRHYNIALDKAKSQEFLHLTGVINVCAAHLYHAMQMSEYEKIHYQNAYNDFQRYGAIAKCKMLESKYLVSLPHIPTLITSSTKDIAKNSNKLDSIDILSILKATQAISSEIRLDKLLQTLLSILLQNAGAQRSVLIMKEGEDWYVEAEGSLAMQKVNLAYTENIKNRNDLPLTLIGYVQRTREKLLMQTQEDFENHYIEDAYLKEVKPQSILIIPIHFQNALRCILYLENRDMSHNFTASNVETVQLLAAQAAISLENAHLYFQATHDPLTGLANRNLLYQVFNQAVIKTKRTNKKIGILFMDIDDFKKVNDALGHEVGDSILINFAHQIKSLLRNCDLAARLGGDEFIVMLEDINDTNQMKIIAERFIHHLSSAIQVHGHEFYLSTSIGVSVYPDNANDIPGLIKQADIALYRVKGSGKGRFQFYTEEINKQLREQHARELELIDALEKNQLCMYYQPIYRVNTRTISHFEALLRWNHPRLGLVKAEHFIGLAEKSGLIYPIGEWVLKSVCQQIKEWKAKGLHLIPVAINVSGKQFSQRRFYQLLKDQVVDTNIDPSLLEFELTESIFIEQSDELLNMLNEIRNLNIKLSIDDFGTYYSSLAYLKRLPIDVIKIDRTFISDIISNRDSYAIIQAIIAMAHTLKLQVIAEGVETAEQLQILETAGVDEVQGHYLNAPMPNTQCVNLL